MRGEVEHVGKVKPTNPVLSPEGVAEELLESVDGGDEEGGEDFDGDNLRLSLGSIDKVKLVRKVLDLMSGLKKWCSVRKYKRVVSEGLRRGPRDEGRVDLNRVGFGDLGRENI